MCKVTDSSFTLFSENGFTVRGAYYMDYSHWLNRGKFKCHLNWQHRSEVTLELAGEPEPRVYCKLTRVRF